MIVFKVLAAPKILIKMDQVLVYVVRIFVCFSFSLNCYISYRLRTFSIIYRVKMKFPTFCNNTLSANFHA